MNVPSIVNPTASIIYDQHSYKICWQTRVLLLLQLLLSLQSSYHFNLIDFLPAKMRWWIVLKLTNIYGV